MRIALTADLHWGHGPRGDAAIQALCDYLKAHAVDVLLLGGDLGTASHFDECLALFAGLACPKALIPGNHDLWVEEDDTRGDSLNVYQKHLPALCKTHGYHYLDNAPLIFADHGLAIVGTINWYDYTWALDQIKQMTTDWQRHLKTKSFTRGRHNDGRFIRWPHDDVRFTELVVTKLGKHLETSLNQVDKALVMTHHPAVYGLNFPRDDVPKTLDSLLWDAFSGNRAMELLLEKHAPRLAGIFSGHTHRARTNTFHGVPAHNIGGDYHFKRLLLWDWPAGTVEVHTFGQES